MKLIYEPKGRAREYAPLAANLYTSCTHGCLYCYAPRCMQRKRDIFHSTASIRKNALALFAADCAEYTKKHLAEPVLMSFVSDPYQPEELELRITRSALEIAATHKVPIHILTKGGSRAISDFELLKSTGAESAFASTLTFYDPEISKKYEPLAACPADRLVALKQAHDIGLNTWVSFEPALSENDIIRFIEETHEYIDLYKIGKISGDASMSSITDWASFGFRTVALLEKLNKRYIVKNDLKAEMEKQRA